MSSASSEHHPQQFGEAVRASREALGISQEELAGRCKLHRTYVAGVERGIRNPSLKSIVKIAGGLDLAMSDLFRRMEASHHTGKPSVKTRKRNR